MDERPAFWKTRLDEVEEAMRAVKKGAVRVAAKSAGGRDVFAVEYGEKQDFGRTANYSSACGASDPKYYANKAGKKPVILLIGAVHGSELEGTSAILNLIRMLETGEDYRGYAHPYLADCAKDCRLVMIPIANPDGRSRLDVDTVHGVDDETYKFYAQGSWKDGSLCGWPGCKAVHPIKDHVAVLGSYFNDDGINLMHDNFFGDMASETRAIFQIADDEAPDFAIHLHGGGNVINEVCHPDYAPLYVKQRIQELKLRVRAEADRHNLPTLVNGIKEDNVYPPKTFNLVSALHHVCGTFSILYESNQGLKYHGGRPPQTWETLLSYDEILTEHYILFAETIKFACDLRKN